MKQIIFLNVFILLLSLPSLAGISKYKILLLDQRWASRPFIVEVAQENSIGIAALESYFIDGKIQVDAEGNPDIGIAIGEIEEVKISSSHAWSFKIKPNDVSFADQTIELCDASLGYLEANLDAWITQVGFFCPWSTKRLVQEIRHQGIILFQRKPNF